MTILFLHGWQSTPGGIKPTYLKNHGHTVFNPKLPDDDLQVLGSAMPTIPSGNMGVARRVSGE